MIDEHTALLVDWDRQALAPRYQPHLHFLVSANRNERVGIAVTRLQIALQEANAQRREEIVLLPRRRHVLFSFDRHLKPPMVLGDKWVMPNDPIVGIWTAIKKAVSP